MQVSKDPPVKKLLARSPRRTCEQSRHLWVRGWPGNKREQMPGGQPRLLSKLIQRPLTRPTMLLFAVFCKTSILIPHNGLKTRSVQRCTYNPPSHGQPHPHLSRHNPLQQAHYAFPHVINVTREQNRLSHYPRMGARWSPSERLDKISSLWTSAKWSLGSGWGWLLPWDAQEGGNEDNL